MSTNRNSTFVRDYFAALSGTTKPVSLVRQYVADTELEHHIQLFEEAFPKYELVADDMVVEGDKVAVRATFHGTHQGPLMGIPATGKDVTISLMLIYRIADGKIVEHWMNADQLSLLQQIGAVPSPA